MFIRSVVRPVWKLIMPFRALFALTMLFFTGCAYTVRESMLFYPRKAAVWSDRIQRKNLVIPFEGGSLKGWQLIHPEARVNLIYFYGNGEQLVWAASRLFALSDHLQANIICMDYRGYGASEGQPGLGELQKDALRIYDATLELRAHRPTIATSFSIGTWGAVHLAAHRPVGGLLLVAPFSSYEDLAPAYKKLGPWWTKPLMPFVRLKAEDKMLLLTQPLQEMKQVKAPLLIIQGEKDRMTPMICGQHMHDQAASPQKQLVIIPGADHNDLSLTREPALGAIQSFLDQICGKIH